jgi:hypothetical protein
MLVIIDNDSQDKLHQCMICGTRSGSVHIKIASFQIRGSACAVMDLNSTSHTVKKNENVYVPSLLALSGPLVLVKTSVGFNTDSEDPLICKIKMK